MSVINYSDTTKITNSMSTMSTPKCDMSTTMSTSHDTISSNPLEPATTTAPTAPMTNSTRHFRLLDPTAELRNRVYEFTFDVNVDDEVDLLSARPPSKNLLLASRQVHHEAKSFYKEGFRKFWKESQFCIKDLRGTSLRSLESMTQVEHFTKVCLYAQVITTFGSEAPCTMRLMPGGKGWKIEEQPYCGYPPKSTWVVPTCIDLRQMFLRFWHPRMPGASHDEIDTFAREETENTLSRYQKRSKFAACKCGSTTGDQSFSYLRTFVDLIVSYE